MQLECLLPKPSKAHAQVLQNSTLHACRGMQALEQTWEWLAEQPGEAAELAALLFEAAPRLGVPAQRASSLSTARSRSLRDPSRRPDFGTSLKECLAEARPIDIGKS